MDNVEPGSSTADAPSGRASDLNPAQRPCRPPRQAAKVARILDRLSAEVREAAIMLRDDDHAQVSAMPSPELSDPWSIVDLVTYDLARRGVKSQFGSEADFSAAMQAATQLLEALGVQPVVLADDDC